MMGVKEDFPQGETLEAGYHQVHRITVKFIEKLNTYITSSNWHLSRYDDILLEGGEEVERNEQNQ